MFQLTHKHTIFIFIQLNFFSPSVSPPRGGRGVQSEGGGAGRGGQHYHLQQHRGGGPQTHTHALQDHDDGAPPVGGPRGENQGTW